MKSRLVQISDIGKVITGKTPPTKNPEYFGTEIPFLTPSDVSESKYVHKTERALSKLGMELLSTIILPPNSIAVSCIGSIGKVVFINQNTITNQQFNSIIPNDLTDPEFLYYFFKNNHDLLTSLASGGSVQPILKKSLFSIIEFPLLAIEAQRVIGKILSDLDTKIQNLQNQNKVLEQTAQTIFKSWFVDFDGVTEFENSELGQIPKGWNVKELPEVTKIVDCLHITKPPEVKNDAYLLQVFNMVNHGLIDLSKKFHVSDKDYEFWTKNIVVKEGDCVISNAGRVGAIAQIPFWLKGGIGRNITAVRPEDVTPTYLLEYLFSKLGQQEIEFQTDSATIFNTLNVRGIKKIRILIPGNNLMKEYENIARPHRKLMEINHNDIKCLTKTRDALLPKLMSGEIRV